MPFKPAKAFKMNNGDCLNRWRRAASTGGLAEGLGLMAAKAVSASETEYALKFVASRREGDA